MDDDALRDAGRSIFAGWLPACVQHAGRVDWVINSSAVDPETARAVVAHLASLQDDDEVLRRDGVRIRLSPRTSASLRTLCVVSAMRAHLEETRHDEGVIAASLEKHLVAGDSTDDLRAQVEWSYPGLFEIIEPRWREVDAVLTRLFP